MKINRNERTVVLEPTGCRSCHWSPGTEATPIDCHKCHGSGRGARGGARGCKNCNGMGKTWDHENRRPCSVCLGDWKDRSTDGICDAIPEEWKDLVRWTVVRQHDKAIGRWAGLIGVSGAIVTVTDYGRSAESDDDAVLKDALRAVGTRTQAIKVVRGDDMRLADEVVVLVTSNGYAVLPSWDEEVAA